MYPECRSQNCRKPGNLYENSIFPFIFSATDHFLCSFDWHNDVLIWRLFWITGPLWGDPIRSQRASNVNSNDYSTLGRTNCWSNNQVIGDLRCHDIHVTVTVTKQYIFIGPKITVSPPSLAFSGGWDFSMVESVISIKQTRQIWEIW